MAERSTSGPTTVSLHKSHAANSAPRRAALTKAISSKIGIAEVNWEGNSKEILQAWPKPIRIDFGHAINEMQHGRPPTLDARPMKTVGEGVFELKTDDDATWYRVMYITRKNDAIYVLDCFEKDTKKTERKDLERSRDRFKKVQQRLMEEHRHANKQRAEQAKPRNKR